MEPREPPAPKACDSGPPALAIDRTALPALPGRPLWQSLDVAMRERSVWRDSLTALLERNAELQAELERIQKALEP